MSVRNRDAPPDVGGAVVRGMTLSLFEQLVSFLLGFRSEIANPGTGIRLIADDPVQSHRGSLLIQDDLDEAVVLG